MCKSSQIAIATIRKYEFLYTHSYFLRTHTYVANYKLMMTTYMYISNCASILYYICTSTVHLYLTSTIYLTITFVYTFTIIRVPIVSIATFLPQNSIVKHFCMQCSRHACNGFGNVVTKLSIRYVHIRAQTNLDYQGSNIHWLKFMNLLNLYDKYIVHIKWFVKQITPVTLYELDHMYIPRRKKHWLSVIAGTLAPNPIWCSQNFH